MKYLKNNESIFKFKLQKYTNYLEINPLCFNSPLILI